MRRPFVPMLLRALLPRLSAGPAVTLASTLCLGCGVLWWSPLSPGALARADAAVASGDSEGALAAYDAIAAWNPVPSVRTEAAMRAAMVVLVEQDRPSEAKHRFEGMLSRGLTGPTVATVREQVGRLSLLDDPKRAGVSFLRAYEADPGAPGSAERLRLAGDAFRAANDKKAAFAAWDRLAKVEPGRRAGVWLAEAEWLLASGSAESALNLYEKAAGASDGPDELRAAHLGAATCHERLGDLDEALAAFDEADLPQEVDRARTGTLRARADGTSVRPVLSAPPRRR